MAEVRVRPLSIQRFVIAGSPSGGRPVSARGANAMAARMLQRARENCSGGIVRLRTGALASSLFPIVRRLPSGGMRVGVGSNLRYARYLEEGTPPHTIRARRVKYLRSAPGHPDPLRAPGIVAVNHPGFEAKRILSEAVRPHRGSFAERTLAARWQG